MKTSNDEKGFLLVHFDLVLASRVGEGSVEPLIERFHGTENFGEDEIEESPQFGEVVLKRERERSGVSVMR